MGLKKFYYNLENRYYNFVERTGLYKVTDKIDKVIPSFILLILLILIIISVIVYLLLPSGAAKGININFDIRNGVTGSPLDNVNISLTTSDDDVFYLTTNQDGLTKHIKLPKNTLIKVEADLSEYESLETYFETKDFEETIYFTLDPVSVAPITKTYNFSVYNNKTNQLINNSGSISFKCLNDEISPGIKNYSDGKISVEALASCNLAIESIVFTGFVLKTDILLNQNTIIYLDPNESHFEEDNINVTFNLKSNTNEPISNIKITLSKSYGIVNDCVTNTAGTCTIEDIAKGEYTATFTDQRAMPIYPPFTKNYNFMSSESRTETLTASIHGYIYLKVIANNKPVENAEVNLKNPINETIQTINTDENGTVIFGVSEIKDYNVSVNAEGYMIKRKKVTSKATLPTLPELIELSLITPDTLAEVNFKVLTADGRGFMFAKIVLFDAETGYVTDYSTISDYDGNASMQIPSGRYIARAFKGSVSGESEEFEFLVKYPISEVINIPMNVSEGILNVYVVTENGDKIDHARVDLYDRFSYFKNDPAIPLQQALTDNLGRISFNVNGDNDYYVVVSDFLNNEYGMAQSRFVHILENQEKNLYVVLYPENSSSSSIRLKFNGVYKNDVEIKDNLKAGEDYQLRYTLFVPQKRSGNSVFKNIGVILRTGSTSIIENDSVYFKHLDVPYILDIKKYTQFVMNPPHEESGKKDSESLTNSDFKWAKIILNKNPISLTGEYGFYNTYEIEATTSVKDIAVFGEQIKFYDLGFGVLNNNSYETQEEYKGENPEIEYFNVYNERVFGVGEELYCTSDFCFSSSIVDVLEDIRYNVSDSFAAKSNTEYEYSFILINNNKEKKYLDSRLIVQNIDEGLSIKNINIMGPDGVLLSIDGSSDSMFDIEVPSLSAAQKITGKINFVSTFSGIKNLSVKFISDKWIEFINQLFVSVASNKKIDVIIEPKVIHSGKNFDLIITQKDLDTGISLKKVTIAVKDKYKNIIYGPKDFTDVTGKHIIKNLPKQNPNEMIFVYVSAQDYETNVTELQTTDKLFSVIPKNLSFSFNVLEDVSLVEKFTINNLSLIDLVVDEIVLRGNETFETIDVEKINNTLKSNEGTVIKGLDKISSYPDNTQSSKDISLTISLNPRARTLREHKNLSSILHIVLSNGDNKWVTEVPIRIDLGFDGLMDNSNCITLSESFWKDASLNGPAQLNLNMTNNCTIKGTNMALPGYLEARVIFDSNPLGKFTVTLNNVNSELVHGNYRKILDSFDRSASYPMIVKYEPAGRAKGSVKGKIEFRYVNNTKSGEQDLISELMFDIDVTNLKDCAVVSKSVLNVGQNFDEFVIENKACPAPMVYRLSCDDCHGLVFNPRHDIEVSETGTSEIINVSNFGATPGAYVLNIFGSQKDTRGTDQLLKRVKIYVRPSDYCLDLERYEFDLYRTEISESTGQIIPAISYDTTNIINQCYSQTTSGEISVKEDVIWKAVAISFLREGIYTYGVEKLITGLPDLFKSKEDKDAKNKLENKENKSDSNTKESNKDVTDMIKEIAEKNEEIKKLNDEIDNVDKLTITSEELTSKINELNKLKKELDDLEKELNNLKN